MAEQLTSVRFDSDTLDKLRTLAEINNTNVAEEVRRAVRDYIRKVSSDETFRLAAQDAVAKRQERVARLLDSTS